ncbi:hypothetical protein ACFV3F_05265 [Streptomyces sp. NPDC059717]|uniref:hypothetical protein n=1 Tax=Streptomyces sp. NPDC059717 TaxID=3346922 RepID=UPI0036C5AA1F
MTHPTDLPRELAVPDTVTAFRTDRTQDGSAVLVLLTVGEQPYTLIEHRFALDRYVLYALTCDLDGIPDPGPRPEVAALIDAEHTGDQAAFTEAVDRVNARIHNLWAGGSEAA